MGLVLMMSLLSPLSSYLLSAGQSVHFDKTRVAKRLWRLPQRTWSIEYPYAP